jgi:hypothetical protein
MAYYLVRQFYCIELPDKPINLWQSGELWEYVNAEEGAKVEIIGGNICIDGAPRPPIQESPRAEPPRPFWVLAEEAKERSEQLRVDWEANRRLAESEDLGDERPEPTGSGLGP